ncbi:hypothetical protein NLJ89_g8427 [Agrocybe chaxingu]|uniref:F-box domain-containing protein n=1 Tax=Agrocybe chaxingu TaxID=84603 RepID=A0A9W8MS64_9AGAR|nr:hypothetical protein NLJ89_g8427 [Agrocybe chaxingu]
MFDPSPDTPAPDNQAQQPPPPTPAPTSFLQAMEELNRQYPPSQPTAGPSGQSNAAGGANAPRRPMPPNYVQSAPARPANPTPTPQQYMEVASKVTAHHMKGWEPHRMAPEEYQHFRQLTQKQIQRVRELEALREQQLPNPELRTEQELFIRRVEYRVYFPRTFRINDLPTEIMDNIFRYIVWTSGDQVTSVRWRMWLTWVCQHWRSIALADTTLWNAIWFRDPPNYERSLLFFERAGNSAIDIRIDDTKERPMTLQDMSKLVDKLFVKLSNIRLLVIVVQDWDPALVVLNGLRRVATENLPMIMERFELHRDGSPYVQVGTGYQPEVYARPIPLFGGASVPTFNYLSLNGIHIDWKNSVLRNLTTLDMRRMPLERAPNLAGFRSLLQNCPLLKKLIMDGAGPKWVQDPASGRLPPVLLPELKVLVLGDFSMTYGCFLFSHLAVPKVIDLTLINLFGDDFSPFFDLMRNSMPLVKILTIFTAKWLASMPQVTYLRLGNVEKPFLDLFVSDDKFRRLTANSPTPKKIVCPKIAYLEYQNIDTPLVAEWLMARKRINVPLKKVYLPPSMAATFNREKFMLLVSTLDRGGNVQVLLPNNKPPEEEALAAS